jgi:hypothetical protein
MKESYKEDLANHFGLEPYAVDGNIRGVASVRGNAGQLLSSEILTLACRSYPVREKATSSPLLMARWMTGAAESLEPVHAWTFQAREPGDPISFRIDLWHIAAMWNGQRTSRRVRPT